MRLVKWENNVIKHEKENDTEVIKVESDIPVYVNGKLVYSPDKTPNPLDRLPAFLQNYFRSQYVDYVHYDKDEEETAVDVLIDGQVLTFYISDSDDEKIHARFDFVEDEDLLNDELMFNLSTEDYKKAYKKLSSLFQQVIQTAKECGYAVSYSHSMDIGIFAWWDLIFKPTELKEHSIQKCMMKINEFNSELNRVFDTNLNH